MSISIAEVRTAVVRFGSVWGRRDRLGWALEGGILLALALAGHLALRQFDLAERFFHFSAAHEAWELDETVVFVVLVTLAALVFSIRRLGDISIELGHRIRAEDRARAQALRDPLTGLPNRRRMNDALAQALELRKAPGELTALLMIDLDRFKPVNDLHGHHVGDAVLKEVANRLEEITRQGETVARLGGDEFAVVLPRVASVADALTPARRILRALQEPFIVGELSCQISGSIGVAVSDGAIGGADLLRHADAALYVSKRQGRNRVHFFESEMDQALQQRAHLELALRDALACGEVHPHYQPLVDLKSGAVLGYEMLARWIPAGGDPVSPEVFIPIAEETGIIGELFESLLAIACRTAATWPDKTTLSVNLSPLQFREPTLADRILTIVFAAGLRPDRLEVEVTESAVVTDLEAAKAALGKLKSHGVRISLDDFGTGYSSLHHLRELPFDKLKIDRSFVTSMQENPDSRKIVTAIIGLGQSLGLETLAEGIESADDVEALRGLACVMGQGFHFGAARAVVSH